MSEQRFVEMKEFDGFSDICDDGKVICSVRVEYAPKLVGLLNEQQATIKKLEEENRELRQSVEYWQKKYEEGTETFQIN